MSVSDGTPVLAAKNAEPREQVRVQGAHGGRDDGRQRRGLCAECGPTRVMDTSSVSPAWPVTRRTYAERSKNFRSVDDQTRSETTGVTTKPNGVASARTPMDGSSRGLQLCVGQCPEVDDARLVQVEAEGCGAAHPQKHPTQSLQARPRSLLRRALRRTPRARSGRMRVPRKSRSWGNVARPLWPFTPPRNTSTLRRQ